MAILCPFNKADKNEKLNFRVADILDDAEDAIFDLGDNVSSRLIHPIIDKCVKDLKDIGSGYTRGSLYDLTDYIYENFIRDTRPTLNQYFTSRDFFFNVLANKSANTDWVEQNSIYDDVNKTSTNIQNVLADKYGYAVVAKERMLRGFTKSIVDSMIIDRSTNTLVENSLDLNRNIKQYHQKLVDNIVDYLSTIKGSKDIDALVADHALYLPDGSVNGELIDTINSVTDNTLGSKFNRDSVLATFSDAVKGDKSSLTKMKAFDSLNILNNFDSLLSYTLGKSLYVEDGLLGKYTDKNTKYSFTGDENNLLGSWGSDELMSPERTIDNITRIIVQTSPMYKFGNDEPSVSEFLDMRKFTHTVSTIKKLLVSSSKNIRVDNYYRGSELSKYGNLYNLIAGCVDHPNTALPLTFKILSNTEFIQANHLDHYFSSRDLDIIYSMHKNFFADTDSIYSLWKTNKNCKYLSYLTQTMNSIAGADYLQYRKDLISGDIHVKQLNDLYLLSKQKQILGTIDKFLASYTDSDYADLKAKFPVYKEDSLYKINIPLDGDTLTITIDPKGKNTSDVFSLKNGQFFVTKENKGQLIDFIDSILYQDFKNKPEYLDIFSKLKGSEDAGIKDLLTLAATSYTLLNYDKEVISANRWNDGTLRENVSNEFGTGVRVLTDGSSNISFFKEGNLYRIVSDLAEANNQYTGTFSSGSIKDGSGNAIPTSTISKLAVDTRHTYYAEMDKKPNAALSGLTLYKADGGIVIARDFKGADLSKEVSKFTVDEAYKASFLYDFMDSMLTYGTKDDTGASTKTPIFAANTSDKSTILKLMADLHQPVMVNGAPKELYKCSSPEVRSLVQSEIGGIYTKKLQHILDDYQKLSLDSPVVINPLDHFSEFNAYCTANGLNPKEYLIDLVIQHNQDSPDNFIELLDNTHFEVDKATKLLRFNRTIMSQIFRANPEYLKSLNVNLDYFPNLTSADKFWKVKELDLLQGLLENKVVINTSDVNGNPLDSNRVLSHLRNNQKDWVDGTFVPGAISGTGRMILAKYTGPDGKTINIMDRSDASKVNYFEDGQVINLNNPKFDLAKTGGTIELQPLIKLHNDLYTLFSEEFICSTIGTLDGHPFKGKVAETSDIEEESARRTGQNKRGAAFTANLKRFNGDMIEGIPSTLNIACLDELFADVYNISSYIGKGDLDIYNGATFTRGDEVILENNSLCGDSTPLGITKKSVGTDLNVDSGNGLFWKTACFGLYNDRIRKSERFQLMNRKMLQQTWTKPTTGDIDITKDYNGESLLEKYKPIYIKGADGQYTHRVLDKYLGNDVYQYTDYPMVNGVEADVGNTQTRVINNSYDLYDLFGNCFSAHLDENGEPTIYLDNSSFANLAIADSYVGTKLKDEVHNASDLYQPLKNAGIHYIAMHEALKQGAANINSPERFLDETKPLGYFRAKSYNFGIQLSKEKEASLEDVSLITQAMSSAASRGFSVGDADDMYRALASLVNTGIKNYVKGYEAIDKSGDPTLFLDAISKIVAKSIYNSTSSDISLSTTIRNELTKLTENGKDFSYENVKGVIPFSNPMLFNKFVSDIAVDINKSSIRQKFNGMLGVLNPSHDLLKLYDNKFLDEYNNKAEIESVQAQHEANPLNNIISEPSKCIIGRSYKIKLGNETLPEYLANHTDESLSEAFEYFNVNKKVNPTGSVELTNPEDYWNLKTLIARSLEIADREDLDSYLFEDIVPGRNLAPYHLTFSDASNSNITYNLYDLDILKARWELDAIKNDNSLKEYRKISKKLQTKYNTQNIDEIRSKFALENQDKMYDPEIWGQASILGKVADVHAKYIQWQAKYPQFAPQENESLAKLSDRLVLELQNTLNSLHNMNSSSIVYVDGRPLSVFTTEVSPYEFVASQVYSRQFGISGKDTLSSIKENPMFFLSKLVDNYSSKVDDSNFDIELKCYNGKHMYFNHRDSKRPNSSLSDQVAIFTESEGGKTFRINGAGKRMYELSSDKDYVKRDSMGNEVIFTDNIPFYLASARFNSLRFSSKFIKNNPVLSKTIFNQLRTVDHNAVHRFVDNIDRSGIKDINTALLDSVNKTNDAIRKARLAIASKTPLQDTDDPYINQLRDNAVAIRLSFDKSLEMLVARIPCQTMQSFMAMKCVGFDPYDTNNVSVSHFQIWLQGSDYDIDTISMMGYDFGRNGLFTGWSKYFNMKNELGFRQSLELPFPTGKPTKIELATTDEERFKAEQTKRLLDYAEPLLGLDKKIKIEDKIPSQEDNSIEVLAKVIRAVGERTLYVLPEDISKATDLASMVNKHNLYIADKNSSFVSAMLKNYINSRLYKISADPINLVESQTTIDDVMDNIKSLAVKNGIVGKSGVNTPGNIVQALRVTNDSIGGKGGTGIMAAGTKNFFGLTQYYNNKLRDPEFRKTADRLLINRRIGNHEIQLLANTRYGGDLDALSPGLRDALLKVSQLTDTALDISGMLALATDNAKDPTLYKINAGESTLGMYVYGLSAGLSMNEIIKIMTSPVANAIVRKLGRNVFEDSGFSGVPSLIRYIDKGFSVRRDNMSDQLYKLLDSYNLTSKYDKSRRQTINGVTNITRNIFDSILSKFNSNLYTGSEIGHLQEKDSKVLLNLRDYLELQEVVKSDAKNYADFKTLVFGGNELRTLTRFFGLNKGIYTTTPEQIAIYNDFENIISNRIDELGDLDTKEGIDKGILEGLLDKMGGTATINMGKYLLDDTYRQAVIDTYDYIKHSFNILDVLNELPHFNAYLQSMFYDSVANKSASAKFRFVSSEFPEMCLMYGAQSNVARNRIERALSSFADITIMKSFLLESGKTFLLPKGNDLFTGQNSSIKTTSDTKVMLGTDEGNATFIKWMNSSAIPKLKQLYPENLFLSSLIPTAYNDVLSGKARTVYTLNIDMMPRSDAERDTLSVYSGSFNDLRAISYYGKNLRDLFFYYDLINFGGATNKVALSPIFESMYTGETIPSEFNHYISKFDTGSDLISSVDYSPEDLRTACAPVERTINSSSEYVKDYNPNTRTRSLYVRKKGGTQESYDDVEYSDFVDDVEFDEFAPRRNSGYKVSNKYETISSAVGNKDFFNVNSRVNHIEVDSIIPAHEYRIGSDTLVEVYNENGKTRLDTVRINKVKYTPILKGDDVVGFKNSKGEVEKFTDADGNKKDVHISVKYRKLITGVDANGKVQSRDIIDIATLNNDLQNLFNDPCK